MPISVEQISYANMINFAKLHAHLRYVEQISLANKIISVKHHAHLLPMGP